MLLVRPHLRRLPVRYLACVSRNFHTHSFHNPDESPSQRQLRIGFDDKRYFDTLVPLVNPDGFSAPSATGLFKNKFLDSPEGLVDFSRKLKLHAQRLVSRMLKEATCESGALHYVRRLDEVSDVLCRAIDAAEFIRVAHPDSRWHEAAQHTHELLFEYMNELNTNVGLYTHLRDILNDSSTCGKLSAEEILVGEYLRQDFERLGIQMPEIQRRKFVELNQEISVLGAEFCHTQADDSVRWVRLRKEQLDGIPESSLDNISKWLRLASSVKGYIDFPLWGDLPHAILKYAHDQKARKSVWVAMHLARPSQVETLDAFVTMRKQLAQMLGFPNYATYTLRHKMARSPENVRALLTTVQKQLLPPMLEEMQQYCPTKTLDGILPWDREYMISQSTQNAPQQVDQPPDVSSYFLVGTVMLGLARLFRLIYGVELKLEPTLPGETWNTGVRKVAVYDCRDPAQRQIMGYLYIDFWNTAVLPLHFTITCLRDITKDQAKTLAQYTPMNKHQQLPVIALVCNFAPPTQTKPSLLSSSQLDTLFHEMGHAMHLMLGRTALHNLLGTRCATDFVELPLILMEHFSRDARVACLIGRHYKSGEPLPSHIWQAHCKKIELLEARETFMQSKMAMLDQALSAASGLGHVNTTAIYHATESAIGIFPDTALTWHGQLSHLFLYGAVYYLYILDRAIADHVWRTLFAADPWSAQAGQRYRDSILQWGGTRDPWKCLADALGDERLAKGDSTAMRIIAG